MNKTQCPHCLTSYIISDEQLRISRGMVRCGTCKERFQADEPAKTATPVFDPRKVFIEPLPDDRQDDQPAISVEELLKPAEYEFKEVLDGPVSQQFIEPDAAVAPKFFLENPEDLDPVSRTQTMSELEHNFNRNLNLDADREPSVQNSVPDDPVSQQSIEPDTAIAPKVVLDNNEDLDPISRTQSISELEHSFDRSLNLDAGSETSVQDSVPVQDSVKDPTTVSVINQTEEVQQELPLSDSTQESVEETSVEQATVDSTSVEITQTVSTNEDQLINEVTQLVDEKLLSTSERPLTESSLPKKAAIAQAKNVPPMASMPVKPSVPQRPANVPPQARGDSFSLNKKKKLSLTSFLVGLALLLLAIMLGGVLTYQLWLKQMIVWPDNDKVQRQIAPISKPIKDKLDELEIAIPVRRNLSNLELLSARTEAHPTRHSTILLRVSLVNRAKIAQPLPWFELSLTDPDGRLVSRRSLSPNDYVHNNRISSDIGPNELKKVTIELLSFPKQATGYELKLLNK